MKSIKHTPGPWRIKYEGAPEIWAGKVKICDVDTDGFADDGQPTNMGVVANARLIAGAPELLEALRKIVNQPVGHTAKDAAGDLGAICRIARAAIEKVTE